MNDLFIDCSAGLAGDMLLAALFDLGVPYEIVEKQLIELGINNKVSINIEESKSCGQRGLTVSVNPLETQPPQRCWLDIRKLILESTLEESVIKRVVNVFHILAEAEAEVHGISIDKVHFHELGSIDTIVDIIGVCSALNYLKIDKVFCTTPPSGSGTVNTDHGLLSVPVPAVMEMAKKHRVILSGTNDQSLGELTTPTGLALLIVLADYYKQPDAFLIQSVGVGLGLRKLNRPNLLRICLLNNTEDNSLENEEDFIRSSVVTQEAWIDDASPEDLALLINRLRDNGALEVIAEPIAMKKGRNGLSVKALSKPENVNQLRKVWFTQGTTIGLREHFEDKLALPRRRGTCMTSYGKVLVKQVKRPDGRFTLKPEFDELSRLSISSGLHIDEIRRDIEFNSETFSPEEDWGC